MALANITNNILTDSGILVTNLTPTSRTITINGVTYDLSADRSWTIAGGLSGSGTANQLTYWDGTSSVTGSATLTYSPTAQLLVNNSVTAASAIARGANFTPTLTAAANNDVLVGLDINPTFTAGAFTGVTRAALRVYAQSNTIVQTRGEGLEISSSQTGHAPAIFLIGNAANARSFRLASWQDGSTGRFVIRDDNAGTDRFAIFSNGNVGINTTTDVGFRLDVNGTARFVGNNVLYQNTAGAAGTGYAIEFATNSLTPRYDYVVNGVYTGTMQASGLDFRMGNNQASGTLSWNISNTKMRMFSTGNILIQDGGTFTDAGFRLDVNGTARVQSTMQVATTLTVQRNQSVGDVTLSLDNSGGVSNWKGSIAYRTESGGGNQRMIFNAQANDVISIFASGGRVLMGSGHTLSDYVPSAALAIVSTSYGFLPPRQTQTQRNAIATPAAGLIVYDTTDNELDYYNGTAWQSLMTLGTQQTVTGFKQFSASRTASLGVAQGTLMTPTLTASANNDVLVGLDVSPTFTNGAFTGVRNLALRVNGNIDVQGYFIGNIASSQYIYFLGSGTGEFRFNNGSGGGWFYTWVQNSSERMRLSTNNNLLINTTTDAGFRLDVNGTARVQNNLQIQPNAGGNIYLGIDSTAPIRYTDSAGKQRINYFTATTRWTISGGSNTAFQLDDAFLFSTTTDRINLFARISKGYQGASRNISGDSQTVLQLDNNYQGTAINGGVLTGLYVDLNTTGFTSYRAIQTTTGDVLLGTTSGSVGIGASTTPAYKLEVNSSTGDNHIAAVGTTPSLQLMSANTSPANWGTIGMATATNNFIVGSAAGDLAIVNRGTTAGNILFGFGSTERMRLTNAGNLGIGTSNPTEKLEVNGNIKATNLLSGTYTPTLTLVGNAIGSVAVSVCLYTRVGNLVTVTGTISGTGSGTGIQQYSYELSLPITQTNTNLRGTATGSGQVIGGIGTNGLNGFQFNTNKMLLEFQSLNTFTGAGLFWNFTFTYEIA